MSDPQTESHSPSPGSADPAEAIRVEVQREYSAKLAQAELKTHAAQAGIKLGDGFTDYLDASKLLGDDGNPSADPITEALAPFVAAQQSQFPQLAGAGHFRSGQAPVHRISLDVRNR